MANLASGNAPASTPVSRPQTFIKRIPTVLDSSDEARTDTSSSPSMNRARSPGCDAKCCEDKVGAAASAINPSTTFSTGRRRKTESTAAPRDLDKPVTKQRKYERKTKRFIWPNDLHRLFVAAIFDVGLKNASPKALLALMEAAGPNSGLTTEHLKSHLQKYRLHYERSRMEFLEYYDRSAKRNLKRRRRQNQHRASGADSEANTMFVFPISNSKCRRGHGSDSDDSDSDGSGNDPNDSSMQVDAKRQDTPKRRLCPSAPGAETRPHTSNCSQFMQSAQQPTSGHLPLQPSISNGCVTSVAPALASTSLLHMAPHHLPPVYAHAQPKQPSGHHRDLAAAAAAMVAHRYPLGHLSGPIAGGVAGMPVLPDPQWNILNSLMSPQLAGMTGLVGEGGLFSQAATSDAIARGGSATDGFLLHEEPSDLQMQMHLAMQAQMNLHRQMLTRKVEVAQHLAHHSSVGSIDSSLVPNRGDPQVPSRGYSESWCNAQQLQHQQYQHQQQQDHQKRYQQQMNILSRPSLSAAAAQASVPTASVRTDKLVEAPATSEAIVVSTTAASNGSAVAVSSTAGLPAEMKGDDDGIDLYRWDRIDLNVELDDDDLFGFLKS
ncbi:unnamed protein product [Peronospora belbahrii]|uniref:HTH myb-type domain-containing protein n=1 Tax=Peronospora belbahrii TaxID=622444 RepID=A0AAU9KJW2_9STRA|nr:unnamed protein product [Peronospora belbahrii]CAH0520793.1 unnamed protein product [Peronospora belbahrii]